MTRKGNKLVPNILGTSDAARVLGVCENTLRKWADQGRIPSLRDSKNRRVFYADALRDYRAGV
jgi:excisionase family DNA binding protein